MFKKSISIFIALNILFASMTMVYGAGFTDVKGTKYEEAAFRLSSLGVMNGYEDGSFKPENNITRAEFIKIVISAMGFDNIAGQKSTQFSDVSNDHWAFGFIAMGTSLGLINGITEENFEPDSNVTYEQALKIIVLALGYEVVAKQAGGYPMGYVSTAASIGLLDKMPVNVKEHATRGNILLILDNAIDIPLLVRVIGTDEYKKGEKDNTLYEALTEQYDSINVRGVVVANEYTALEGNSTTSRNTIKIGDEIYHVGQFDPTQYLGYYVDAYIKDVEQSVPTLISMKPYSDKNEVLTIDAKDLVNAEVTQIRDQNTNKIINTKIAITYEDKNSKDDDLDLSAKATVFYNGKRIDKAALTTDDLVINNGTITLIDNDDSGDYDVIMVSESESFIADRITEKNTTVYFPRGIMFRGREGFKFNFEDNDVKIMLVDTEGNTVEFSEIKENSVLTLEVSMDETFCKAIVSNESVQGTVTELNTGEDIVRIDDEEYKLYKDKNGNINYIPSINDQSTFLIDANGRIVGNDGTKITAFNYGYVVATDAGQGLMANLQLRLAQFGDMQKNVQMKDDTEIVKYTFKNADLLTISVETNVRYNGVKFSVGELAKEKLTGNVIKYRLNGEGNVSHIEKYDIPAKVNPFIFNTKIMSFGGYSAYEGFLTDKSTQFIMVPNAVKNDKDYLVDVEITNKTNVKAVPFEIDVNTQVAESVVIYAEMDSNTPKPFDEDTPVSIVGKVSTYMNEDGEMAYKVQMLTGDKEVYAVINEGDKNSTLVKGLEKGDLIKYNENSKGFIDNIEKLATIQGRGNAYYNGYPNSPNEEIFGVAKSIKLNRFSSVRNEMVDEITVMLTDDDSGKEAFYYIPREDAPMVYRYDRSKGNIYAASTDEIIAYDTVGSMASKAFMFVNNSKPSVIVIIHD